ncbi:hypothetical protein PHISP_06146 [Aspergillus sp. HF37]|nr:hypothetical protein PHISP_06146 [Aspergillus sp. HF37]
MDMGHDHGGMDMGGHGQCDMNMLFTWSTKNLCIIFRGWRITGPFSLILSLIAIALLTAGYEGVRRLTRQYETAHAQRMKASAPAPVTGDNGLAESAGQTPHGVDTSSPLLVGRDNRMAVQRRAKITMAALYAVQVFYSFFIMLLFMTYNGLVMLSVAVGAFVGYLVFGDDMSATKSVACH